MKRHLGALGLLLASITAVALAAGEDREFLSRVVARLGSLERITETPHPLADSTIALCRLAFNPNPHEGKIEPAYCHVYVSKPAKETLVSGKGVYPVDALLVKAKLDDESSRDASLFTVMRKREPGYDPEHGDWEYAVLDGPTRRVLSRGRIDSCIECHQQYKSTDFVTRAYLSDE